jgi:hypothetical protein
VPDASPPPVITLLTRPGCHLCHDARDELARLLDERAAIGLPRPDVHEVDIESEPALLRRHLETIPVLVAGGLELPLAIRASAIRAFLAQALDGTGHA